jgi:hypothetical protein
MKNITVNILAMIASTIIFTFNTASAAEWVKVIEMGESVIAVEFPMTPAEISAEKARRNHLAANRRPDLAASKNFLKTFEMGEGGHRVEFPMTAAEITAANGRFAVIRSAGPFKSKKPVVGFEMAESGHFIEFPVTISDKKMDIGDCPRKSAKERRPYSVVSPASGQKSASLIKKETQEFTAGFAENAENKNFR